MDELDLKGFEKGLRDGVVQTGARPPLGAGMPACRSSAWKAKAVEVVPRSEWWTSSRPLAGRRQSGVKKVRSRTVRPKGMLPYAPSRPKTIVG